MISDKAKFSPAVYLILPLLAIGILSWVDASSIFSYLYTLVLFLILNKLLCKGEKRNFLYFHYYLAFAILLFVIHRYLIPGYLGMTGPEGGIGTDDCRYYAQLQDGKVPYKIRFNIHSIFPFTIFLKTLYPFSIATPLNIIILNLLGIAFLPYFVKLLSYEILRSTQVAKTASKLILLCPFATYYGCILMRDMWIATLVVAGLYYFRKERYILFVLLACLVCFIRFGSAVFLGMGLLVLMRERIYAACRTRMNGRVLLLFMLGIVVCAFMVLFPYLQEYSGGKLESGLFRASYYSMLNKMDSDAVILRLMTLPVPLNYIALTVFFFFLPFWNTSLYTFGIFSQVRLFCSFLTPIFFFFLWKYIVQTVLQNLNLKQNLPIKTFVYMALAFALSLGTVSLQARHKTVLMPLLCILAAYGMHNSNRRYNRLASFLTVIIIAVQVYMVL